MSSESDEAATDQPTAAPADQGPAAGPPEQEAAAGTQAERRKKFSRKLQTLRRGVIKAVREYSSFGATAAKDLLPADRRDVPPQIVVVGISPYKKLFHEASPAFERNHALDLLQQAVCRGLENYQDTAVLASRAAISQGVAAAAPVVPQTAPLVQPRAVSEMARKQQVVRNHFNSVLKLQMDAALAKAKEEMRSVAANRGETAAADHQLRADGFQLHDPNSDCCNGCQSCGESRLAAGWPQGVRLLKNPTKLKKAEVEAVMLHYNLKLDAPASGSRTLDSAASASSSSAPAHSPAASSEDRTNSRSGTAGGAGLPTLSRFAREANRGGGSTHRPDPLQSSVPVRNQTQHPGHDRGLENLLRAREQAISSRGALPNSGTAAASGGAQYAPSSIAAGRQLPAAPSVLNAGNNKASSAGALPPLLQLAGMQPLMGQTAKLPQQQATASLGLPQPGHKWGSRAPTDEQSCLAAINATRITSTLDPLRSLQQPLSSSSRCKASLPEFYNAVQRRGGWEQVSYFYCKDVILELGLEQAIRNRSVEQVWSELEGLWVANLEKLVDSTLSPVVDQEFVQVANETQSGRHQALRDVGLLDEDMPTASSGDLDASNSLHLPLKRRCRGPDVQEERCGRKWRRAHVNYAVLHGGSPE